MLKVSIIVDVKEIIIEELIVQAKVPKMWGRGQGIYL